MSEVLQIHDLEIDLVEDHQIHYVVVAIVEDAKPGRSDLCYPADIAEPGFMLPGVCSATFQVEKDEKQPNLDSANENLEYIRNLNLSWELDHDEF
tara:strand:+ start:1080 stop:1364 length:285 start_codon:yes stop_codon:yes gene_type:complete